MIKTWEIAIVNNQTSHKYFEIDEEVIELSRFYQIENKIQITSIMNNSHRKV